MLNKKFPVKKLTNKCIFSAMKERIRYHVFWIFVQTHCIQLYPIAFRSRGVVDYEDRYAEYCKYDKRLFEGLLDIKTYNSTEHLFECYNATLPFHEFFQIEILFGQ